MRRSLPALAAAALLLTGCYHVTVVTGAPEAQTKIAKPWQMSFVYGLVPPPEINAQAVCNNGVAKVETQVSFINGLVGALTWSLVTPMQVDVTCASGPVSR